MLRKKKTTRKKSRRTSIRSKPTPEVTTPNPVPQPAPVQPACAPEPPPFPSPRTVVNTYNQNEKDELLKRLQVDSYERRHARTVTPIGMSELVGHCVRRDNDYFTHCEDARRISTLFFNEEGEAGYLLLRRRLVSVASLKEVTALDNLWRQYLSLSNTNGINYPPAQACR